LIIKCIFNKHIFNLPRTFQQSARWQKAANEPINTDEEERELTAASCCCQWSHCCWRESRCSSFSALFACSSFFKFITFK